MYDGRSEDITDLAKALSAMQAKGLAASKDSTNPHFNRTYADIGSCWDAIREPLTENGLSIVQTLKIHDFADGKPVCVLITTMMHTSGQWLSSELPLMVSQMTSQGQGSAITYARRYALAALTGIYQVDDDGNEASDQQNKQAEKNDKKKSPAQKTEQKPQDEKACPQCNKPSKTGLCKPCFDANKNGGPKQDPKPEPQKTTDSTVPAGTAGDAAAQGNQDTTGSVDNAHTAIDPLDVPGLTDDMLLYMVNSGTPNGWTPAKEAVWCHATFGTDPKQLRSGLTPRQSMAAADYFAANKPA